MYLQSFAEGGKLYHKGLRYTCPMQMAHMDHVEVGKAREVGNMLLRDREISDVKLPALWKGILQPHLRGVKVNQESILLTYASDVAS